MWRFLEGVKEPPSKKPRLSNEERKAQVKEYEEERIGSKITMKKSMLNDNNKRREWLEYDSDKNQMLQGLQDVCERRVPEKGTLCHWNTKFHAYWLIITHL